MEWLREALAGRLMRGSRRGAPEGSDLSHLLWSVKGSLAQRLFAKAYDAQGLVQAVETCRAVVYKVKALSTS